MLRSKLISENYKSITTVILFIGLLLGMLMANLGFREYLEQMRGMEQVFLLKVQATPLQNGALFVYLAKVRLGVVVLLALCGTTRFGGLLTQGYCLWIGFSFGMYLSVATMQQGFYGLALSVATLFPQCLLYIPAGLLLLRAIYQFPDSRDHTMSSKSKTSYWLLVAVSVVLTLIGVCLETYIHPLLLKRMLGV